MFKYKARNKMAISLLEMEIDRLEKYVNRESQSGTVYQYIKEILEFNKGILEGK